MFGGLSRVFEDDPFFRDPFAMHHERMCHLFDPFGRDPFPALKDSREGMLNQRASPDSRIAPRDNHKAMSFPLVPFGSFGGMTMSFPFMPFGCFGGMNMDFRDPFSAMDKMMSNMRNNMRELQRSFDKMATDPNAHSFSSSSVMTYSKMGDEPPKVFQASSQTRMGPGGIKETRKALKDSESGLEKMSVGHHIQDRAHIIQKAKNNRTGDEELNQEFVNLDEAEAHVFDEEWQKEIRRFVPSGARNTIDAPRHRRVHHANKEDATRREKTHPRTAIEGPRRPRSLVEKLNIKGSHVPLKNSKK
ncbi:myeloid leukemia factor 1 isoform X3 [Tiliqua scincoides]|uniref:myeloid leukemia factor 1 isoform X3 n=1 Tax=Tiliqua scincoides TaxID=71010 RepID=UPI003461A153